MEKEHRFLWQQLAQTHSVDVLKTDLAAFQAFVSQRDFTARQIPDSVQLQIIQQQQRNLDSYKAYEQDLLARLYEY